MSSKQRVNQQPAWILHSYPWRETSLIVEVFSREYGRLALVAKGARRPYSLLRGVLMSFQPLSVDWSGGGEVKTLVRAEWCSGQPLLTGSALLCGYYLNELLIRLLAREDAYPELFDIYVTTMQTLAGVEQKGEEWGLAKALRGFELALLRELGYCAGLHTDARSHEPVQPELYYCYMIENGPVLCESEKMTDGIYVRGQVLLDMSVSDFSRPETLQQSKPLLRALIHHHLGDYVLQSRRILEELQTL